MGAYGRLLLYFNQIEVYRYVGCKISKSARWLLFLGTQIPQCIVHIFHSTYISISLA